jgi:hypothetical protein
MSTSAPQDIQLAGYIFNGLRPNGQQPAQNGQENRMLHRLRFVLRRLGVKTLTVVVSPYSFLSFQYLRKNAPALASLGVEVE